MRLLLLATESVNWATGHPLNDFVPERNGFLQLNSNPTPGERGEHTTTEIPQIQNIRVFK